MTLTNSAGRPSAAPPGDASAGSGAAGAAGSAGPAGQLAVRDSRTGRDYEIKIDQDAIRAVELAKITAEGDEHGLLSYDPAFQNTASCRSAITFIDGDLGILLYRGYPIEELAATRSFLDVAHLLVHGELPTPDESRAFAEAVKEAADLPEGIVRLVESFPHDAHPMAVLLSAVAGLGAYRAESKQVEDAALRKREIPVFLGSMASLAGLIFRHFQSRSEVLPAAELDYAHTFAANLFADVPGYVPDPAIVRAMNVLLILQADHEQNCSTNAVRAVGSSRVDPYSAFAGGIAALYGPLHGGANEAVMHQLRQVANVDDVATIIKQAKSGEHKLMGFGHRIYKNYDPRAKIIKETAEDVFKVTGTNPLLDVAIAIERAALSDEYFVSRKLYPNVDFYSGLIYEALGLPTEMFTVFFAASRMAGWAAQWLEMIQDPEQKIARPRQIYVGHSRRQVAPV